MMTSIDEAQVGDEMIVCSIMFMRIMMKCDYCVCQERDLPRIMWAKRPLALNTLTSAIICIHFAAISPRHSQSAPVKKIQKGSDRETLRHVINFPPP